MSMLAFAGELGLGIAFTLIALAPMLKQEHNPLPKMKVDIAIGLPEGGNSSADMGGAIPNVALFDANGGRLGFWKTTGDGRNLNKDNQLAVPEGAVMDGGTAQLDVDYLVQGDSRRPEYITLSASGFDAVCIMSVVVKHPLSDEHFAFLPGEVAKICTGGWADGDTVIWSEQAMEVTFELEGQEARLRPKRLWIDSPDAEHGPPNTKWKGFGVHLPDFAVDNTTFQAWEDDNFQMCDSKARFGLYEKINEAMCPPVFNKAPKNGAKIPMEEYPGCAPGLVPDANGNVHESFCDDPSINKDELQILEDAWHHSCKSAEDRENKLKPPGSGCKRDPAACVGKRFVAGAPSVRVEQLQARFHGKLVKSYDIGQSARGLCNSKGSVGPNFYSHHEKSFCDMSRKKLFPLCELENTMECFDVFLNKTRHSTERREETVTHEFVSDWW